MPPLPLWVYMGIGALLCLGVAGIQTWRLDHAEEEISAFRAASKAQQAANEKKAVADAKLKKEKDDENRRKLASADERYQRLLKSGAVISLPADPTPGGADLACFDRPQFLGAINQFLADAARIALEGDKATIGIDTARSWAQELLRREP